MQRGSSFLETPTKILAVLLMAPRKTLFASGPASRRGGAREAVGALQGGDGPGRRAQLGEWKLSPVGQEHGRARDKSQAEV